jgi:ferredoxin-type protein NapF
MIDFMSGACTFCGACAAACNEHVFNDVTDTPWTLVVNVSDECLLPRGVSCQSCTDACDVRALRFDLRQRPLGALRLDSTACTGCGACIGTCPVNALSLAETATQAKSV